MLGKLVPSSFNRAFADDIASVIEDWEQHIAVYAKVFAEFYDISNLDLNMQKTVCIPLWPGGVVDLKPNIASQVPSWKGVEIQGSGTYLGFVIGPDKQEKSWEKPLGKFCKRVFSWAKVAGGRQFATLAYNTFALSTLCFVGQLERVPESTNLETNET